MNPKYYLLAAVAALSLGGCSTDDTVTEPEIGGYKLSFTIAEDSETRTTLDKDDKGMDVLRWVPTDKIGIFTVGKNVNSNILTTTDVNQSPVEFVGTLDQPASSGDMFYAYYPYNDAQTTDPAAVKLSIPTKQSQTQAGVYNGESHPLVAVPMEFSQEWGNAGHISNVRFRQLGAIVELQLYSSDETLRSESIRSVSFVSDTPLAGDFSFDLTTVTVKDELSIAGYESKVATTLLEEPAAIPAAGGEAARVYLTIAPGQYTGKIVVNTDVAQYTFRLAKAMNFKRAVIKGLPADLAKAERNADAFIHFEDAEVKQICVVHWDKNGDGELSYEEAAAVTSIESKFDAKSIRSFNELQYFTGLQFVEYRAFNGCSSLTSIKIPDGVTWISSYAFNGCSSLKSLQLPDGVTDIGVYTFYGCSSLKSINIPDGVTRIGFHVFNGCSSLTSINIPDGVTTIETYAFNGCSSLTSLQLPDGVTRIGDYAFYGCNSLTSINIPEGVTTIEWAAFGECSSLTSIHIPDGVTTIDNTAFDGCSNLTSINIPDKVTTIGDFAFSGCSSLKSINIPDGVTTIESGTFCNCSSLTSINIPTGVTSIEGSAFENCSSLREINIPTGVTAIENYAFAGCRNLTSINIPDKVTSIGAYTFYGCSSLTSISIPDGVTEIGSWAFRDCSSLTSIHIPEGVGRIGDTAFAGCSNLTSINIPDKVTTIEDYTFNSCSSLTSINIPEGVTAIGNYVFSYCSSLTSVYCKPTTPPTLGDGIFYNTPSSLQIYVPTASVDTYKEATGWSDYASQIFAENN